MTLECANCGHSPETVDCPDCGRSMPTWADYCPFCGARVKTEAAAVLGDPLAMENRRLCPDGDCIGILGEDGRCVICGKS